MKDTTELFTSSATIEWGSPLPLVHSIAALGFNFVLDVCATPGRQIFPNYYAPPPDEIGKYKVTKGPEKGTWKYDHEFRARSFEEWRIRPPIGVDALKQPWAEHLTALRGVAWENPPFGRQIKPFMRHTFEQAKLGACIVTIVPSRTGSSWWHDYVEPVRTGKFPGEFDFFKGRVTFTDRNGEAGDPAPFDMTLVVFDGRRLGA